MTDKGPITADRVERVLDTCAWVMSKSKKPHLLIPIWKRLEMELARLREEEDIIRRAKTRAEEASAREVRS